MICERRINPEILTDRAKLGLSTIKREINIWEEPLSTQGKEVRHCD